MFYVARQAVRRRAISTSYYVSKRRRVNRRLFYFR
ncbi:hypothetical protein SPAB_01202 [Salmonella enterica subsp. enterica serovar Paratyphi B str. SPB7]|uniref:Uncharacterized protein n=1 Tax=Salmonella paratyphi B (strain ATCC BAA-1250 / SPB7) TaxID=1016998 RepID=A0A6C6YZY3_SALPB|nr:hypothetical protein SPAB_01202 [Salmonella enterica subsp. enterica serovar Paratyphi B str. SPB7]